MLLPHHGAMTLAGVTMGIVGFFGNENGEVLGVLCFFNDIKDFSVFLCKKTCALKKSVYNIKLYYA
ncbi:MAG: hypothetical protein Q4C70_01075 [Planctomycetia bacterium]|nr:hypothetical protein [Planctomycetia bacterium]